MSKLTIRPGEISRCFPFLGVKLEAKREAERLKTNSPPVLNVTNQFLPGWAAAVMVDILHSPRPRCPLRGRKETKLGEGGGIHNLPRARCPRCAAHVHASVPGLHTRLVLLPAPLPPPPPRCFSLFFQESSLSAQHVINVNPIQTGAARSAALEGSKYAHVWSNCERI